MSESNSYDREEILLEIGAIICFECIIQKDDLLLGQFKKEMADPKDKYFGIAEYYEGINNYLSSKIPEPYHKNAPIENFGDLKKIFCFVSAERMANNIDEIAKKNSDPERSQKLFDFAAEMINAISNFSFCDGKLVKSDDGPEKFVGGLIKSIDDLDYFLSLGVLKLVAERSGKFDITDLLISVVDFNTIKNQIKNKTQNEIDKKISSVMEKIVEYASLRLSHDQYRCKPDENWFVAKMGGFWCNILDWCNNTETVLKMCNGLTEPVYVTLRSQFFNHMLKKINLDEMPNGIKIKRSLLDYLVKKNLDKTKQMNLDKFKKILMLYMNSDDDKNIPFDWLVNFVVPIYDQKKARELIFNLNQVDKNNLAKTKSKKVMIISSDEKNYDDKDKEVNIFLRLLFKIKHLLDKLIGFFSGNKKNKLKQINYPDDKTHIKEKNSVLIKSNDQKSKSRNSIPGMINSERASRRIN